MNLDTLLKRYFPLIVCAMLAVAAYFQASGIGGLVASTIGAAPSVQPRAVPMMPVTDTAPGAGPILRRNPFDSVTGPLDGRPDPTNDDDELMSEPGVEGDPDADQTPKCTFGRVVLIAANEDPEWAFAAIDAGEGTTLRRVGDTVKDHALEALAWDRVYLTQGSSRCQMQVGDRQAKAAPAKKPARKASRGRRGAKLPDDIANKIHKVSDTEFNIERSVVDQILEQQAQLMRNTRMRPIKDGDKVVGMRVSRVREGTLLDALGVKNGDQIQSINGFELTDPQRALEAYGRLRTANKLSLTLMRGGSPTTIEFNIQ